MKTPTLHEANRSITQHAVLRLAQRGVCKKALKLLTLHGIDVPAGSGSVRRELRQQQVVDLYAQGYCIETIEKALRLEAIFGSDEALVTCYPRSPRRAVRGVGRKASNLIRHRRTEGRAQ
jgi:hypothetical protein